jgi:hypothetical protein
MVVATKYKLKETLSINAGTWRKDGAKEKIHTKIVSREFVENRNSHNNNELYIIDEDATLEMMEQRELNIIENAKKAKRDKMDMSDLIEAVVGTKEAKPKKTRKAVKEVEPVNESTGSVDMSDWTLEELQQYCRDNDIKHHHANKEAKLLELISKA